MSFKEITHCVQRFEMLEERVGIEIRGLMVTVEDEPVFGDQYHVSVMAEITATGGSTIKDDIEINISCYNSNQQVCGTSIAYIYQEDFFGLEILNEDIFSKGFPVEIKLIPKII